MKPLLSGPVVTRLGAKFPAVFVFVVNGNRFSNVDEAGATVHVAVFSPANCALSAEMGVPAAFKSLHASTMLKLQLPAAITEHNPAAFPPKLGIATSAGIVSTTGFVSVVRKPS